MKKNQNMPVSLRKIVLLSNNAIVCRHCLQWMAQAQQHYEPGKKSVINMNLLLLSVSDWPIIMIGPGGLLLVVHHLFSVLVTVVWVGLQKSI
jgi:hypothetical protein